MSREIVACVASKPCWRSRRRSSSWLCSGSWSINSRMMAWRRVFMTKENNYTSIFIDRIERNVYKYSFRCIQFRGLCPLLPSPPSRRPRLRTGAAPAQPVAARVAVAGATGYTGQELLRLLSRHPAVDAHGGDVVRARRRGRGGCRRWRTSGPARSARSLPSALAHEADVVFMALPDVAAAELGPSLVDAGVRVIDLSGAFRLRDDAARARWYPETHRLPAGIAYGLTERERGAIARAQLVANPGCYPTATLLALAPLIDAGLIIAGTDIIVDAKSGVSGAGKTPSERTHFSEIHGSLAAYGVFGHRHGAEIEQGAGREVTFTPHLVPLDRGILSTIYVRVAPGTTEDALGATSPARLRRRDVRPPDRLGTARDQARRAHEFLRHRLAGGPRPAGRFWSRSSTTCSRAHPARPCRT